MIEYRSGFADDSVSLLAAYHRCSGAELTPAQLQTLVREVQLDCALSLVAYDRDEPVGILLAARRDAEALVYRLAVHPDHLRKGYARSLLAALARRLSAPTRIVAEAPADSALASALLERCGFARDSELTDYVLDWSAYAPGASGAPPDDSFLVPVSLDDILADPALGGLRARGWERAQETLVARKDRIEGLALAALNEIAAFLLYRKLDSGLGTEIVALCILDLEDGEAAAGCLLDSTVRRAPRPIAFRAAHAEEVNPDWLARWGFRPERRLFRFVLGLP